MAKRSRKTASAKSSQSVSDVLDGWGNVVSGLGEKGIDQRLAFRATWLIQTEEEIDNLYAQDDISKKIVNRKPNDGTREWIELTGIDDDKVKENILEVLKKLKLQKNINKAWKWARLYGGSAIIVGVKDGEKDLSKKLRENRIKNVIALTVVNRFELTQSGRVNSNILSQNFGMPESYQLSNSRQRAIHNTRVVRFEGELLPRRLFETNGWWHDSVLNSRKAIIRDFNQAHDSVAHVVNDFKIDVIKIKNLATLIASGEKGEKLIKKRLQLMRMLKSVLGMMALDMDETFEKKVTQLQGLKDVLDKIGNRLVAASGYPHTIILGDSPGVMSEGKSELRDYYDTVAHLQEDEIRDPITRIIELVMISKEGPTKGKIIKGWGFNFNSLWQPTNKELAETRKSVAETDALYISLRVLEPEEVRSSRFGGQDYSMETTIDRANTDITKGQDIEPETPEETEAGEN